MANRQRNPWLVFGGRILFRVAFAGFILIELVLWVLLLWGVSTFVPEDNFFVGGILIALLFLGLFPIGACSYLIFQRMTRVEYVLAESERWLAEQRKRNANQIRRHNRLRRWAMWIPSLAVLFFCLFLDTTWPALSHLLHTGYGRLGAYRVSIPLDWAVIYSDPNPGGSRERSYVRADHWKRMLRSGIDEFTGKRPSLTSSSLGCDSSRSDEYHAFSPLPDRDLLVASRNYSQGNVALTCEEFVSRDPLSLSESRTVSCVTAERDFDCVLYEGDERDVWEFYDMVQHIKKVK